MSERRERILIGRTYIETLLLNLTQIEFTNPSPDVMVRIVSRLEEEVCALSTIIPEVKTMYGRKYRELVKEYFGRDLPIPDNIFEQCFIIENLLNYLLRNPSMVLEHKRFLSTEADKYIKSIVARLGKSAALLSFYACGLIKVF